MTNVNTENNGSKKKYLVPLIVLLLCGVAMTGAAYAYSSNMSATGTVDAHSYEITLEENKANVVDVALTGALEFNTTVAKDKTTYALDTSKNTATFTVYMINGKNTDGFAINGAITVSVFTDSAHTTAAKITATAAADNATAADSHVITVTFTLASDFSASDIKDTYYLTMAINTTGTASA